MEIKTFTRAANFSSSEIWKLLTLDRKGTGFGAPALKYIQAKKYELLLDRQLQNEVDAKPLNWGLFLEKRVFDLIGLEYKYVSDKKRYFHLDIPNWCGIPDCITDDIVVDIKCPFTLLSFCETVDAMRQGWEALKEAKPEWYWQLLSNKIITERKYCELILYVPYKKEIAEIREAASNFDGNQGKLSFINFADDEQLPYLIEGRHYKNLENLKWEPVAEDLKLLTEKVKEAVNTLNH